MIAEDRKQQLTSVAKTLRDARISGKSLAAVDEAEVPLDMEEVYFLQDFIAPTFGKNGGWKIGAPGAGETPFFAPMPQAWIEESGVTLSGPRRRLRGVEAEIAFLVGHDLSPRAEAYTRMEVVSAIASAHPAIEVLESGFTDPRAVPRLAMFGDMQMHGGFVPGPPIPEWQQIDWATESVKLVLDGKIEMERTASNPAGTNLLRLLVYLANEGAARTGGLHRGDWITTGSWTGATWVNAGTAVEALFTYAGSAKLHFA